jgi:hypothetical protein
LIDERGKRLSSTVADLHTNQSGTNWGGYVLNLGPASWSWMLTWWTMDWKKDIDCPLWRLFWGNWLRFEFLVRSCLLMRQWLQVATLGVKYSISWSKPFTKSLFIYGMATDMRKVWVMCHFRTYHLCVFMWVNSWIKWGGCLKIDIWSLSAMEIYSVYVYKDNVENTNHNYDSNTMYLQ